MVLVENWRRKFSNKLSCSQNYVIDFCRQESCFMRSLSCILMTILRLLSGKNYADKLLSNCSIKKLTGRSSGGVQSSNFLDLDSGRQ